MGSSDTHDNPFDDTAPAYEVWYGTPLGSYVIAQEEGIVVNVLPPPPGRVLDIGAGTGWWSRVLAARGFDVVAVEPSGAMRRVDAERGPPAATWVEGTAEELPFADGSFDVALMITVIEFLDEPERALREALRVVRAAGTLVVGFLEAASPWAALYRRLADHGTPPWTTARFLEAEDVEAWLGRPADVRRSAAWLAPGAGPPFDEADRAGQRAGNVPAFTVLGWRNEP